jgi:hypothetical protein
VNTSYLLAGFGLLHASASTHLDMPFGFFLLRVVFPAAFCISESIFGVWDLILVYDTARLGWFLLSPLHRWRYYKTEGNLGLLDFTWHGSYD